MYQVVSGYKGWTVAQDNPVSRYGHVHLSRDFNPRLRESTSNIRFP